jgi:hypothetical protein
LIRIFEIPSMKGGEYETFIGTDLRPDTPGRMPHAISAASSGS